MNHHDEFSDYGRDPRYPPGWWIALAFVGPLALGALWWVFG